MSTAKWRVAFNPKSIRFRLTLFFVGFLGFTLFVFSSMLYRGFVQIQETDFNAQIYNYATDISRALDVTFFGAIVVDENVLLDRSKVFPFKVSRAFIQVIHRNGRILSRSPNLGDSELPVFREDLLNYSRFQASFREVRLNNRDKNLSENEAFRMVTLPLESDSQGQLALQVAVPQDRLDRQIQQLLNFFVIAIPITLLALALGSYYISGRALAPVLQIIEKASRIGGGQVGERLPVPEVEDELKDLSLTLNQLLDRLQRTFESQERFVADASHQLRTPLAILRGELDVLRSRERTKEELDEFMESVSQELEHLSRMVNDLLLLARVDSGRDMLEFHSVRLDEVVLEVISRSEFLAKSKEVKIKIDFLGSHDFDDYEVDGDPDLIRTMIQNLVENAIKYSETGRNIEVKLNCDKDEARLMIKNWGHPIPAEQMQSIFNRFYRVEGQTKPVSGMGLGLAIVKQIAEAHRGNINVRSTEGDGTEFELRIPKIKPLPS